MLYLPLRYIRRSRNSGLTDTSAVISKNVDKIVEKKDTNEYNNRF